MGVTNKNAKLINYITGHDMKTREEWKVFTHGELNLESAAPNVMVQRKLIQVSMLHLFNKAHSESGHLCFLAIDPSTLLPKSMQQ